MASKRKIGKIETCDVDYGFYGEIRRRLFLKPSEMNIVFQKMGEVLIESGCVADGDAPAEEIAAFCLHSKSGRYFADEVEDKFNFGDEPTAQEVIIACLQVWNSKGQATYRKHFSAVAKDR